MKKLKMREGYIMLKKFFGILLGATATAVCLGESRIQGDNRMAYDPAPTSLEVTDYILNGYSYEEKDFKDYYFDNLKKNFGHNYKGSCGYVAIGMVLSYYDTFWSDEIIPEQYDVNSIGSGLDLKEREDSPGILDDVIDGTGLNANTLTNQEYLDFVHAQAGTSLHARLIEIGQQKGYYRISDKLPCGTTHAERRSIVWSYFNDVLNYKEGKDYVLKEKVKGFGITSHDVRSFAIEQVQKGNLVILGIKKENSDKDGHVVVGYGYDEKYLVCHLGWEGYGIVPPEYQHYTIFDSALVIEFKTNRTKSNNYIWNNGKTELYFSYEDISDNHELVHHHHFDNKYKNYSAFEHYAYCCCEESKVENHSYCDHYSTYSKTQHKVYCACGAYKLESHVVKACSGNPLYGIRRAACKDCGALIDLTITPIIAD